MSIDLRVSFIDTLITLADKDKKIVLIVPDVGFKHADRFKEKFRDRYFNFGVTEQSTVVAAAAMALSGLKPYVYSMRNFILYRPYEMVRNAIVCHNANVKLIGVSGSSAYKFLGFSHNDRFEDEDVTTATTLGLVVNTPKTPQEVIKTVLREYKSLKPSYTRL